MKALALLLTILSLTACANNSGVQEIGPHTFTVVRGGSTGFTSVASLKSAAYKEANEFAASKGKQIEVIDVKEVNAGFGRYPQVEIHFKLIDK